MFAGGAGIFPLVRRRGGTRSGAGGCRGLTVAGRGCRNGAGPGGWCGRCGGVAPLLSSSPTGALGALVADPLAPSPWLAPSGATAVLLAKDPSTDPGALHRLAAGGWSTRMAVAANPSTSPETLIWLAGSDDDPNVVARVAAHPNCPRWIRARIGLEAEAGLADRRSSRG